CPIPSRCVTGTMTAASSRSCRICPAARPTGRCPRSRRGKRRGRRSGGWKRRGPN
ncbi:MAG: hypothetical protein AVDCRST_MAG19-1782, partial [uncultured Thermomicrobiales bacterium]